MATTTQWMPPSPETLRGHHRAILEIKNKCDDRMRWLKFQGFAALASPHATLADIHWNHVLKGVWSQAWMEVGYSAPEMSLERWQQVLHMHNLTTVQELGHYMRRWEEADDWVLTLRATEQQPCKAAADLGGWLADYANTWFLAATNQIKPTSIYKVISKTRTLVWPIYLVHTIVIRKVPVMFGKR